MTCKHIYHRGTLNCVFCGDDPLGDLKLFLPKSNIKLAPEDCDHYFSQPATFCVKCNAGIKQIRELDYAKRHIMKLSATSTTFSYIWASYDTTIKWLKDTGVTVNLTGAKRFSHVTGLEELHYKIYGFTKHANPHDASAEKKTEDWPETDTNDEFVTKVLFKFLLKRFGYDTLFSIEDVKLIIKECNVEDLNDSDFKSSYIFRQAIGRKIKIGLRAECVLNLSPERDSALGLFLIRSV